MTRYGSQHRSPHTHTHPHPHTRTHTHTHPHPHPHLHAAVTPTRNGSLTQLLTRLLPLPLYLRVSESGLRGEKRAWTRRLSLSPRTSLSPNPRGERASTSLSPETSLSSKHAHARGGSGRRANRWARKPDLFVWAKGQWITSGKECLTFPQGPRSNSIARTRRTIGRT